MQFKWSSKDGGGAKSGISPHKDWIIILASFFILMLIGVSYEAYLFVQKKNQLDDTMYKGESKKDLKDVGKNDPLVTYKQKALDFERVQNEEPSFVDPAR